MYIFSQTQPLIYFHHSLLQHTQVKSMEFYDDLHDIYDLVTLDDEDVINNKPHFPEDEIPYVASDLGPPVVAARNSGDEDKKPLAP
jgi:uncharacterized protein YfkK (UPF0435 family)